jgi:Zn-dependent protease with chaperone function
VDFFSHQDRARRNTSWLIVYFAMTVVAIVATVYVAASGILFMVSRDSEAPTEFLSWDPPLFFGVVGSVLAIITLGSLYKIWQIGGDGHNVAVELGGVKVPPNTRDLDERILLNVVEEMALASGTPVPPVYLLPNEPGINAFAAGTTPQNAVIGVTRGCIQTLSRDELQGVIAHEFSHILNGDMRLNLRLIGWLHGILLIAMIGYLIVRMLAHMPARSSRSDDDAKGAMALIAAFFTLGLTLIAIGYIGVFFASLIQSAVSRQREYLADASAVQFTRHPGGISGALQRIGGWASKSRLRAVYAKEASHMFFGQGVMSLWFATHPPLVDRIRRIDPTFRGEFPKTEPMQHSESDIVDPRTLRQRRAAFASAHVAALAGVEHFEREPSDAVSHVGRPEEEHIDHAHRLVEDLPAALVDEVHDPFGALAVVYGLLLAPASDPIRGQQLESLARFAGSNMIAEIHRVISALDALEPEQRLPMACMALPALDQLSAQQVGAFRTAVRNLIEADRRWTIFEYALQRFIVRRLVQRTEPNPRSSQHAPGDMRAAFQCVLSTLAHLGGNAHAEAAFNAAWSSWRGGPTLAPMLAQVECTLSRLDKALDQLQGASNSAKRGMLQAFSECIAFDRRATINELELLRVFSDALGCPMPPVLDVDPPGG